MIMDFKKYFLPLNFLFLTKDISESGRFFRCHPKNKLKSRDSILHSYYKPISKE